MTNLRRRALRRGVWFRALSRTERGVVDLTIRCVERVNNSVLGTVLSRILTKLEEAVEHFYTWRLTEEGRSLAAICSQAAVSWGYGRAAGWRDDRSYMQLLGLNRRSSSVRL